MDKETRLCPYRPITKIKAKDAEGMETETQMMFLVCLGPDCMAYHLGECCTFAQGRDILTKGYNEGQK